MDAKGAPTSQTLRESLLALQEREVEANKRRKRPSPPHPSLAKLDGPELPEDIAYLWEWFRDLGRSRQSNGFSANRFTNLEILAWDALNRWGLHPWEADAIKALDGLWFEAHSAQVAAKRKAATIGSPGGPSGGDKGPSNPQRKGRSRGS